MRLAVVVVDLGFGDSGKGSMVDYFVRKYGSKLVVRYGGGPQAAHNVVEPGGRHHTFAQFGSGTLAGANTYLAKDMIVEPLSMMNEAQHLKDIGIADPLQMAMVDWNCVVTTPYHAALNKIRELSRSERRHGSCGMGIGEARSASNQGKPTIRVRDIQNPGLEDRLNRVGEFAAREAYIIVTACPWVRDSLDGKSALASLSGSWGIDQIADRYREWSRCVKIVHEVPDFSLSRDPIIFEGSQGLLIDQSFGFHPYTTWSDVTTGPAYTALWEGKFSGPIDVVGVIRAYPTRHGPGPFPTESKVIDHADFHNAHGRWQGDMRYGFLDLPLLRYALCVESQVKFLAITHLDLVKKVGQFRYCDSYVIDGQSVRVPPIGVDFSSVTPVYNFINAREDAIRNMIRERTGALVGYVSYGPTYEDKYE